MENLVLASSSLRRQALLQQLGWTFEVCVPDIDESVLANETASAYVQRLAREKAQVVLRLKPQSIVIAADTTVSLDEHIIGKPENKQHAFEIWSSLSAKTHTVLTSVCVANAHNSLERVVATQVEFQKLTAADMQAYWETGEPVGKAGAYAIQGIAAQYIPQIVGSYSNVVGLPLYETRQMLLEIQALDSALCLSATKD